MHSPKPGRAPRPCAPNACLARAPRAYLSRALRAYLPRAPACPSRPARLCSACRAPAARPRVRRALVPRLCAQRPACARLLRLACRIVACAATQSSSHCSSCHNTIFLYYNTNSLQPSLLQYNLSSLLPAIQYLYCNTLQPSSPFKLQYKPCLATQNFLFLQYNLGSSPIQFFCTIFFSFFFHYN